MGIYSIKKFGMNSGKGRDRVGVGIRSSYIRVLGIQVDTDGSGELLKPSGHAFLFFFMVGLKPRTLCIPGKYSTTELYSQSQGVYFSESKNLFSQNVHLFYSCGSCSEVVA